MQYLPSKTFVVAAISCVLLYAACGACIALVATSPKDRSADIDFPLTEEADFSLTDYVHYSLWKCGLVSDPPFAYLIWLVQTTISADSHWEESIVAPDSDASPINAGER